MNSKSNFFSVFFLMASACNPETSDNRSQAENLRGFNIGPTRTIDVEACKIISPDAATATPALPPAFSQNGKVQDLSKTHDLDPNTGYAPDGYAQNLQYVKKPTTIRYSFNTPQDAQRFTLFNETGFKNTESIAEFDLIVYNNAGEDFKFEGIEPTLGFATTRVEFGTELKGITHLDFRLVELDTRNPTFQGQWAEVFLENDNGCLNNVGSNTVSNLVCSEDEYSDKDTGKCEKLLPYHFKIDTGGVTVGKHPHHSNITHGPDYEVTSAKYYIRNLSLNPETPVLVFEHGKNAQPIPPYKYTEELENHIPLLKNQCNTIRIEIVITDNEGVTRTFSTGPNGNPDPAFLPTPSGTANSMKFSMRQAVRGIGVYNPGSFRKFIFSAHIIHYPDWTDWTYHTGISGDFFFPKGHDIKDYPLTLEGMHGLEAGECVDVDDLVAMNSTYRRQGPDPLQEPKKSSDQMSMPQIATHFGCTIPQAELYGVDSCEKYCSLANLTFTPIPNSTDGAGTCE